MGSNFNQILQEIPNDFEGLLKALKNSFRINLILLFLKRNPMHLAEIATITNKENSVLLNHLKKIELPGIAQNFLQKRPGTKEYSYYELTTYGKSVLEHLMKIYNGFYNPNGNPEGSDIIPDDLIINLIALSSKFRFALAMILFEPSSFSDLVKQAKVEKSRMAIELKKLESGGILQNYLRKQVGSKDYSFYETTAWAKILTRGLMDSYNQFYSKNKTGTKKTTKVSSIEKPTVKVQVDPN